MDYNQFLGFLSIVIALLAYSTYFKGIFVGKTRPHAFSWLLWGILAGNGFFAQITANAGIGSWVTGVTCVVSLMIFCIALSRNTTQPSISDWVMLALALLGLVLLLVIHNKSFALCITLFTLVAAFAMTARKAYKKPLEDRSITFLLNTLKFLPAMVALSSFSFLTIAYPLTAALGNAILAIIIFTRRNQLAN